MTNEEKNPIDLYYDMKEGRIKLAQKSEENSGAVDLFNKYLALTRTMAVVFQHSHWKCSGSNFYGNHLLFQRLYGDAASLVDLIAEKLIGVMGNDSLKHSSQLSIMSELFSNFDSDNHVENAKEIVNIFLEFSDDLYNRLKEMNELTLGMDDLIMANASKVEEFGYLLKQVD